MNDDLYNIVSTVFNFAVAIGIHKFFGMEGLAITITALIGHNNDITNKIWRENNR